MVILRVGDPHAKVRNQDESRKLIDFVIEIARKYKADRIELLGDLFDSHAVIRLEVLSFWSESLTKLSNEFPTVAISGNHDQILDTSNDISAIDIFEKFQNPNLVIVNKPTRIGIYGYVPYMHDRSKFVNVVNQLYKEGVSVCICHQAFEGSQYENGFYAPDGIDRKLLPPAMVIISGHVHKYQVVGDVIHPGTPRWDSISDANQPKGIWIFEHENLAGKIVKHEFISTEHVCQPMFSFTYKEDDDTSPAWPESARVSLELVGTSDWISKQKEVFKGRASISTKITDKAKLESRKIGQGFEHFITNYSTCVNKQKLLDYMRGLKLV